MTFSLSSDAVASIGYKVASSVAQMGHVMHATAKLDTSGWSQHDKLLLYFHYMPSLAGAEFFTIAFGLLTIVSLYLSYAYPKPASMHILTLSAALECVGYGTRVQSIFNISLGPFVVSILFVLLAPILLALINYITVGNLIEPTGKRIACIEPKVIKYVFFASDFSGLIIQAIGGSVLASANTAAEYTLGANITLAGLAIQVGFFTIFTYMMFISAFGKDFRLYYQSPELKTVYNILFVTTILIYVRNIFRLIEYASPHTSYIPTHEWPYFIFESTPICAACAIYCIWHFGRLQLQDIIDYSQLSRGAEGAAGTGNKREVKPTGDAADMEMVEV
jgi:hypothetical protein